MKNQGSRVFFSLSFGAQSFEVAGLNDQRSGPPSTPGIGRIDGERGFVRFVRVISPSFLRSYAISVL